MKSDIKRKLARAKRPSGRFVLRLPPELHAQLKSRAAHQGLSLNELCVERLSRAAAQLPGPGFDEVVARLSAMFGANLVGALIHGSWVRGTSSDQSDIDLMAVLDASIAISRTLYRTWDEDGPQVVLGRKVDCHFVHLPAELHPISSVWAELSLDGVVLFERDLCLSRRLIELRTEIAAGRLIRRIVHGQAYWSEVA